jgi:antitoxin component of MazEF toxin-antitoxin module
MELVLERWDKGLGIRLPAGLTKKLSLRQGSPVDVVIHVRHKPTVRKIGLLDGRANIRFADDFAMTTDELLAVQ